MKTRERIILFNNEYMYIFANKGKNLYLDSFNLEIHSWAWQEMPYTFEHYSNRIRSDTLGTGYQFHITSPFKRHYSCYFDYSTSKPIVDSIFMETLHKDIKTISNIFNNKNFQHRF